MSTQGELERAGYKNLGETTCAKCKGTVAHWQSPSGTDVYLNTETHPTGPGILHHWTCMEKPEELEK